MLAILVVVMLLYSGRDDCDIITGLIRKVLSQRRRDTLGYLILRQLGHRNTHGRQESLSHLMPT